MSVFIIKIIACLAMLIDHVGIIGYETLEIFDYNTYKIFRGIGRLAFPLFAFLLVNGWMKTKDRKKYLSRLVLFSFISQIPYTLAIYPVNRFTLTSGEIFNHFNYSGFWIIQLILLIAYFIKLKGNTTSIIWEAVSIIIVGLQVKFNGIWIFNNGELNVFYTLALGIIIMDTLDTIIYHRKEHKMYINLLIIASTALTVIFIGTRSDYGLIGLLLITALYFCKDNKPLQALIVCIWGIGFYGIIINNTYNAIFTCISAVLIIAYNRKKSISLKYIFYLFYPIHLLVLGIINIFIRLG